MQNGLARRSSPAILVAAVLGTAADVKAQVNNPPSGQRIEVAQSIAEKLSKALPIVQNAPTGLNADVERLLVDLLPQSIRKSCGDLVEVWGPGRNDAVLSARLLHAHREGDHLSVLLAYRCARRQNPHFDPVFDDRPALLVRNGARTSLTLLSPYKPEECCDPHSVEFLKTLPLTDGQLLELGVQSTSYGDGADSSSRYELVWVADPGGNVALKIDSRTENDGYDADSEKSHESVCDAKVRDEKDVAGNLTAIVAETACTEDKVAKPSETVRYLWDGAAGRFRAMGSKTNEQASSAP